MFFKKRPLKRIGILLIVVAALLLLSFIVIEALILTDKNDEESLKNVGPDYVIVLGARLYGEIPSPALHERLLVASRYLEENKSVKVIVSGGKGDDEDISEALAMKIHLMDSGIDEDRIIMEDKSTSTFENLKFSKEIIEKMDGKGRYTLVIVSSRNHLFRAKLIARRLDISAYGLEAAIPPSSLIYSYIREYFAFVKTLIFDH